LLRLNAPWLKRRQRGARSDACHGQGIGKVMTFVKIKRRGPKNAAR
jgi:hypothetical protein